MPTPDEIRAYLSKRGFSCDVEEKNDALVISLYAPSAEPLVEVLSQIKETRRVIVSLHLTNVTDLVMEEAKIADRFDKVYQTIEGRMNELQEYIQKCVDEAVETMRVENKDSVAILQTQIERYREEANNHHIFALEGIAQAKAEAEKQIEALKKENLEADKQVMRILTEETDALHLGIKELNLNLDELKSRPWWRKWGKK